MSRGLGDVYKRQTLTSELETYNLKLLDKTFLIIANKNDLEGFAKQLKKFTKKYPDYEVVEISALNQSNLDQLKLKMFQLAQQAPAINLEETSDEVFIELAEDFLINKIHEGLYEVSGTKIEQIYHKIPLTTYENILRFNKKIRDLGLWKALIDAGIQSGDTVRILNYQFVWEDE